MNAMRRLGVCGSGSSVKKPSQLCRIAMPQTDGLSIIGILDSITGGTTLSDSALAAVPAIFDNRVLFSRGAHVYPSPTSRDIKTRTRRWVAVPMRTGYCGPWQSIINWPILGCRQMAPNGTDGTVDDRCSDYHVISVIAGATFTESRVQVHIHQRPCQ
jgi:hypothetical protein